MKRLRIKDFLLIGMLSSLLLLAGAGFAADEAVPVSGTEAPAVPDTEKPAAAVPEKAAPEVPQSELDKLKTEWEAVREQQVQMIREKEDQLEKLKEEIFSKMKAPVAPAVAAGSPAPEISKTALQAERQKFFAEMSRQKESLRQLQAALDEKTKQLAAERERFEQEKKTAAR